MKSRTKPNPHAIRPGDYIHLTVPENRYLPKGVYLARVESLAAKSSRFRITPLIRLTCTIILPGTNKEHDDPDAFLVYFQVQIPQHEALKGQCFLGPDDFPVTFLHEPNLERRLRESLPAKERPRYADS